MKTIIHYGKKDNLLHVETPLGIVNIYVNLHDTKGRPVENITIIPNDRYIGEPRVKLVGKAVTRLIQLKTKKGGKIK